MLPELENRLVSPLAEGRQGEITQYHSICDKSRDIFTHDTVVRQGQVGLVTNPAGVSCVTYLNSSNCIR